MIKDKLNDWLIEHDIKPATFAAKIGVKNSTVDDILKGKTNELNIGVDKVLRICSETGMTVEELYDRKPSVLSSSASALVGNFEALNEEGQEKLIQYSEDLVASGRYIKNYQSGMDSKEA